MKKITKTLLVLSTTSLLIIPAIAYSSFINSKPTSSVKQAGEAATGINTLITTTTFTVSSSVASPTPTSIEILNACLSNNNNFPNTDINHLIVTDIQPSGSNQWTAEIGVVEWSTIYTGSVSITVTISNPILPTLASEINTTTLVQSILPSTQYSDVALLKLLKENNPNITDINQIMIVNNSKIWDAQDDCWHAKVTPVTNSTAYSDSGSEITIKYSLARTEVKDLHLTVSGNDYIYYVQPNVNEVFTSLKNANYSDTILNTRLWNAVGTVFTINPITQTDSTASLTGMTGNQYYTITQNTGTITISFSIYGRAELEVITSLTDTNIAHILNVGGFGTVVGEDTGFLYMDEYLVNPTFYSIPSKNDIVYFLTQWDNTTNWINSDINYDELDFTLKNRNNWVGATTNYVVGNYVVDSISKTVYKCILDINQSPSNFRPALDATHWTVSSDETIIIAPVVGSLVYQNTSGADLEIPYNFFA